MIDFLAAGDGAVAMVLVGWLCMILLFFAFTGRRP